MIAPPRFLDSHCGDFSGYDLHGKTATKIGDPRGEIAVSTFDVPFCHFLAAF
jgi:hypothetical protein